MNQHTISKIYKNEGGNVTITQEVVEGDLSQNVEVTIPAFTTNAEIVISIPVATLLAFACGMTRKSGVASGGTAGPLTVKTNNASTPGDTLPVITPTNGVCWTTGDGSAAKPLTTAVTKLFVSNPGDRDATLIIRALNDSTPVLVG